MLSQHTEGPYRVSCFCTLLLCTTPSSVKYPCQTSKGLVRDYERYIFRPIYAAQYYLYAAPSITLSSLKQEVRVTFWKLLRHPSLRFLKSDAAWKQAEEILAFLS